MALFVLWEESLVIASLACLDPWLDICHSRSGKFGVFVVGYILDLLVGLVNQAGSIGYDWDGCRLVDG